MTADQQTLDMPTKVGDLGKAVAVIERAGQVLAIPENLNQQIEFAKVMSQGGAMIGKPFRNNPGACLGICNQAWQWGMNPFSVSQKAYLVNEVIAFEAQLVHAVVLKLAPLAKRPRFDYEGEGDQRRCTVTFWVKGEDEPLTYTSPPYSKITPKNSPLWKTDPDQQQAYYTIRAGARRYFPEVLMGVMDREEAIEIARIEEAGTRAVTLGGDEAAAIDTDFTPIDAVINKGKPAADSKPPKKTAARKGGEVAQAEESPPADTQPAPPANEPVAEAEEDDMPTDEAIVAGVEAGLKATRTGKAGVIRAQRAALQRIAETGEDEALRTRADKLLNLYDLDA